MIDYECCKTFGEDEEVKVDGYAYNIGGGYGVIAYKDNLYIKKSPHDDVSKIEGLNTGSIYYETWNEPGKPLRIRIYEQNFDKPAVADFLDNFIIKNGHVYLNTSGHSKDDKSCTLSPTGGVSLFYQGYAKYIEPIIYFGFDNLQEQHPVKRMTFDYYKEWWTNRRDELERDYKQREQDSCLKEYGIILNESIPFEVRESIWKQIFDEVTPVPIDKYFDERDMRWYLENKYNIKCDESMNESYLMEQLRDAFCKDYEATHGKPFNWNDYSHYECGCDDTISDTTDGPLDFGIITHLYRLRYFLLHDVVEDTYRIKLDTMEMLITCWDKPDRYSIVYMDGLKSVGERKLSDIIMTANKEQDFSFLGASDIVSMDFVMKPLVTPFS